MGKIRFTVAFSPHEISGIGGSIKINGKVGRTIAKISNDVQDAAYGDNSLGTTLELA